MRDLGVSKYQKGKLHELLHTIHGSDLLPSNASYDECVSFIRNNIVYDKFERQYDQHGDGTPKSKKLLPGKTGTHRNFG